MPVPAAATPASPPTSPPEAARASASCTVPAGMSPNASRVLPAHLTQVLGRGFRQGRLLHLHQPAGDVGRGRAAHRFARKRRHGAFAAAKTRFRRLRRQVGRLHGRRLVHQLRTLGHQTRRPRGVLPCTVGSNSVRRGRQLAFAHPPAAYARGHVHEHGHPGGVAVGAFVVGGHLAHQNIHHRQGHNNQRHHGERVEHHRNGTRGVQEEHVAHNQEQRKRTPWPPQRPAARWAARQQAPRSASFAPCPLS